MSEENNHNNDTNFANEIGLPDDEHQDGVKPNVKTALSNLLYPDQLYLLPLNRRPFFPGMAAPVVIEPGAYYEVLKIVAKTDHKCLGLFLTKDEDANIYKINSSDLHQVGVVARILRIIPMEQGGAQVVLNMEKRVVLGKTIKNKYLLGKVRYQDDPSLDHLSRELKAYSISIITTIKELLKLNPCLLYTSRCV